MIYVIRDHRNAILGEIEARGAVAALLEARRRWPKALISPCTIECKLPAPTIESLEMSR